MIRITECPRDAMQGIKEFIPTENKIRYINAVLKAGFDTVDFGSFVSPKIIPQMRDTAEVFKGLDLENTSSKLLAIVANLRGAEEACVFDEIALLGFPFSVSETFQQRNTHSSISGSLGRVEEIQALCLRKKKRLVVYLSMAFGNPYGDEWNSDIVLMWAREIAAMDIKIIALADTIGVSNPSSIRSLFSLLVPELPGVEIGAHLHTMPATWEEKLEAAWEAGCRRFDSAIKGYGGCPMAKDELTGNMPTERLLQFAESKGVTTGIDKTKFSEAMNAAAEIFL